MPTRLRKSDIKQLAQELDIDLDKRDDVVRTDDALLVNDKLFFVWLDEWIPSILFLQSHADYLPKVTVDMGAVRFMAKGADVMRPGILQADDFAKNDLVCIVDEKNGSPLAVGRAKLSSEDLMQQEEGNVIDSLHHVGDAFWKSYVS